MSENTNSGLAIKGGNGQDIRDRAFSFALSALRLVELIPFSTSSSVLTKQLLRSATSVGANLEEAEGGLSKNDFIHSVNIARKEARESLYWLRLIKESGLTAHGNSLLQECDEIVRILTAIVKKARDN